jgi:hypothetical protein
MLAVNPLVRRSQRSPDNLQYPAFEKASLLGSALFLLQSSHSLERCAVIELPSIDLSGRLKPTGKVFSGKLCTDRQCTSLAFQFRFPDIEFGRKARRNVNRL